MQPYYKKYWSTEKFPDCSYEQLLATMDADGVYLNNYLNDDLYSSKT